VSSPCPRLLIWFKSLPNLGDKLSLKLAATKRKEVFMSQPVSRYLHPFEVAGHPTLEPEVKRAILASWASDRVAVEGQPALRRPPGARQPVSVDEILAALQSLDGEDARPTLQ
jgi:hypothetical protein